MSNSSLRFSVLFFKNAEYQPTGTPHLPLYFLINTFGY